MSRTMTIQLSVQPQQRIRHVTGDLVAGDDVGEQRRGRDDEHDPPAGDPRLREDGEQVAQLQLAHDEHTHEEAVDAGGRGGLRGGEDSAVDATQDDDRHEQPRNCAPERPPDLCRRCPRRPDLRHRRRNRGLRVRAGLQRRRRRGGGAPAFASHLRGLLGRTRRGRGPVVRRRRVRGRVRHSGERALHPAARSARPAQCVVDVRGCTRLREISRARQEHRDDVEREEEDESRHDAGHEIGGRSRRARSRWRSPRKRCRRSTAGG